MKSFGQLSEDIEERRAAAKQRLKDQESTLKMKGAAVNQAAMERETYTNEAGKRMHYKGYTARDGE